MSTAIGVTLFVIGVGALLLSVLRDRPPPSRGRLPAQATDAETSGTPHEEADVAVGEPDVMTTAAASAPATVTAADWSPAARPEPEPAPTSPGDKASAAGARLAQLRAELVGRLEPEPVAPAEQAAPALQIAEGTEETGETAPAVEVEEPPGSGHRHAFPLVNHGDLVTHLRHEHPDLESSGSTIQ
ncbi:MAG: hypothetical protein ACXWZG_05870, partial [Microbacterium sp.]